ncbi:MAG: hypothetical protein Q9P14_03230 [candidate division KSB1 bacterium]|nr:hypothetical protein [candidate division KSB1 bacterium]
MAKKTFAFFLACGFWFVLFMQWRSEIGFHRASVAYAGKGPAHRAVVLATHAQCDTSIDDTKDGLEKPNQSKVFYFADRWWTLALRAANGDWTLWRHMGGRTWDPVYTFNVSSKARPDVHIDVPDSVLYIFFSGTSDSDLWKFHYNSSTDTWDVLFWRSVPVVHTVSGDPASFLKARNGDLWAFMANNNQVVAAHSIDDGLSWSTVIIDSSLTAGYGLTDALCFRDTAGVPLIGVAVGEDTDVAARFHFYWHREADPETVWVNESNELAPLDQEQADDHIAMAVDAHDNVYIVTKNHGSGPNNSLYIRHPDSTWQALPLNQMATWTRPAVIVDATHDSLYVMGSLQGDRAEYKRCKIGEESTLVNDSLRVTFLQNGGDYMVNLSVPVHAAYDSTELLVIADNSTQGNVWFAILPIGHAPPCPFHPQPIDSTIRNLTITRNGNHVVLTWTAIAEADSYGIYRGLHPMFSADTSLLAMVTQASFTDSNALGNPDENHFYQVRAFFAGTPGPLSKRVGEFEYRLISPPGKTNNFIALCLQDTAIQWASDFVTRIGPSVDLVSKWTESAQAWGSYIPGLSFTDFPVDVNEVYMISVTQEDTLVLLGDVPIGHQYSLITTTIGKNNNGIMLLMDADTIRMASELAQAIGSVDLVSKWTATAQAYGSYIPGLSFTDFPIYPGQPLMVSVTADTVWPVR